MDDAVAAARTLRPLIEAHAAEGEAQRRLSAPVVDALTRAGLMRLCVPAAYGGPELDPMTVVDVIAAVSEADGATGWCVMIASTTSSMACFLAPEWAERIYGDPMAVTGGALAPNGRGERVEGGYVVSGQWPWGSGTSHCNWIAGGATTDDGGFHLMFAPASEVEILDTWNASGLRGTASNDFRFDGVLVPDGRSVQPIVGRTQVDVPLAHFPNFNLLAAGVAATTLGIARRAVDELIALAGGKVPAFASRSLAQSSTAQADIARAEAALRAGRAFLDDELGSAWDAVLRGDRVETSSRAGVRLACVHAARSAVQSTDLAYDLGGGSSIHSSSPLQRCFRDVHTATAHLMISTRMYEMVGKVLFGVDVDTSML
jgi:alkylation response protein AidB-like acyl-CoA dehydrogenase